MTEITSQILSENKSSFRAAVTAYGIMDVRVTPINPAVDNP